MGWLFINHIRSYKEMADHILRDTNNEIVGKALVGRELYVAYKHNRADEKGFINTSIVLFLMEQKNGEVGYKDMGEEAHPYYYACPESILKLSTLTCESSTNWREACRHHARQKKAWPAYMASLPQGQKLKTTGGEELEYLYIQKNKLICRKVSTQEVFAYGRDWFGY